VATSLINESLAFSKTFVSLCKKAVKLFVDIKRLKLSDACSSPALIDLGGEKMKGLFSGLLVVVVSVELILLLSLMDLDASFIWLRKCGSGGTCDGILLLVGCCWW